MSGISFLVQLALFSFLHMSCYQVIILALTSLLSWKVFTISTIVVFRSVNHSEGKNFVGPWKVIPGTVRFPPENNRGWIYQLKIPLRFSFSLGPLPHYFKRLNLLCRGNPGSVRLLPTRPLFRADVALFLLALLFCFWSQLPSLVSLPSLIWFLSIWDVLWICFAV